MGGINSRVWHQRRQRRWSQKKKEENYKNIRIRPRAKKKGKTNWSFFFPFVLLLFLFFLPLLLQSLSKRDVKRQITKKKRGETTACTGRDALVVAVLLSFYYIAVITRVDACVCVCVYNIRIIPRKIKRNSNHLKQKKKKKQQLISLKKEK